VVVESRLVNEPLFDQGPLIDWLKEVREACAQAVRAVPEADLLQRDPEEWTRAVVGEYRMEPLTFGDPVAHDEGEHEVSRNPGQKVFHGPGPHTVPGRRVSVTIPYQGTKQLLSLAGEQTMMSPLKADVREDSLVLSFEYPSSQRINVKHQADTFVEKLRQNADWQARSLTAHNDGLATFVAEEISARRKRVLEDREFLDGLGIPVTRRDDAPKTYAAPGIVRRRAPQPPTSSGTASTPIEPTLVDDFYQHIIDVISAMARGMERTPGDYASWSEEKLRDVLLVILNTHYKGQATGETFNKGGKTDVLVRIEDRNVFVDECKLWTGAAAFAGVDRDDDPSALDQLLSYTTWRDAKLALTVFVKNKNIAPVITAARDALEAHPAFLSWSESAVEGQLRCRVRLPGTDERAADLAVIFVHLPPD
jgi:hypothetical protein